MLHNKNKFYIYAHVRPDTNEVFYIGKGKGKRSKRKHGRNQYWRRIVSINNGKYDVIFLGENLLESLALELETALIKQFKERGVKLCNLTDGGEGLCGFSHSKKTCEKISMSLMGDKHPRNRPIIQYDLNGTIINSYISAREAERQTGIHHSNISKCCKSYKHVKSVGGFKWSYKDQ